MKRAAEGEAEIEVKVIKPDPGIGLIPGRMYFNKVNLLPDEFNQRARSLEEILQEIRPMASIHFNFMIDFPWLLDQYPTNCQNTPITLVVGDRLGTGEAELKKDVGPRTNVTVLTAHVSMLFGTHHTKLSILEDENFLHVVVSTANLIPGDWEAKTQCFYYTRAVLNNGSEKAADDFRADLLHYLRNYNLPDIKYWLERIASYSFPANGDRLIYSFPGTHKGENMKKVGHLSAREKLSKLPVTKDVKSRLFVLQCSSIGSLGASIQTWIEPQFIKSLKGGRTEGTSRTYVIYPTAEDVRLSIEGYAAGKSLPYTKKNAQMQPWMQSVFCKWRSEKWARSRAMPHCKTYTELHDGVPQWIIMTSANLSKAAWGEMQKNSTQLMIRSFEMGVLVTDAERSLLPYDYPLIKYSVHDKPWICDQSHHTPDSNGISWILP